MRYVFGVILAALILASCSDDPPNQPLPPTVQPGDIQIRVVDSGYAEISLRLIAPEGFPGMQYRLDRDGTTIREGRFFGPDTVVADKDVKSSTSYLYSLYRLDSTGLLDTAEVYGNTKFHYQQDTTSHDVDWEIFRFGKADIASSFFRDVYIIDENDIWAVGKIRPENFGEKDEYGRDIQPFNAVHWDGNKWEMRRLDPDSINGKAEYSELYCVWGFAHNKLLLVANGGKLYWWDENRTESPGTKMWEERTPLGTVRGAIRKIWASSPAHYYLAGTKGSLTQYTNGKFSLIETNTTAPFSDDYSHEDGPVWVAGFDLSSGQGWDLLQIDGGKVTDLSKHSYYRGGFGVYATDDTLYAPTPLGLQIQSVRDTSHGRMIYYDSTIQYGVPQAIRGSGDNNIFVVGFFSTIFHYNGKSFKLLNTMDLSYSTWLVSVAVTDRIVVAVGWDQVTGQALLYKGTLR